HTARPWLLLGIAMAARHSCLGGHEAHHAIEHNMVAVAGHPAYRKPGTVQNGIDFVRFKKLLAVRFDVPPVALSDAAERDNPPRKLAPRLIVLVLHDAGPVVALGECVGSPPASVRCRH